MLKSAPLLAAKVTASSAVRRSGKASGAAALEELEDDELEDEELEDDELDELDEGSKVASVRTRAARK